MACKSGLLLKASVQQIKKYNMSSMCVLRVRDEWLWNMFYVTFGVGWLCLNLMEVVITASFLLGNWWSNDTCCSSSNHCVCDVCVHVACVFVPCVWVCGCVWERFPNEYCADLGNSYYNHLQCTIPILSVNRSHCCQRSTRSSIKQVVRVCMDSVYWLQTTSAINWSWWLLLWAQ